MGYKVALTGASGMVGRGVLLECLDDPSIDKVITINRNKIRVDHPKHVEVILKDFGNPRTIEDNLSGLDACFFCLGTSALGKSEEEYTKITYDYTIDFATVFLNQNPGTIFCYVSGQGTDSTEKGRSMWARVKGKTENTLIKMAFKKAYMFRPGFIQPLRGIKSKTNWYQWIYTIFKPFYFFLRFSPSLVTNTENVGKAMIATITGEVPFNILGNKMINRIAKQ